MKHITQEKALDIAENVGPSSTMDLADMFAAADSAEHHSCLFGLPDDFQAAIADKQKARAALAQRVKEIERDAKRYRWLRQTQVALSLPCQTVAMLVADVTELDRAMSEAALTKAVEISQEYKLP